MSSVEARRPRTGEEVLRDQLTAFASFIKSNLPAESAMRSKLEAAASLKPEEFIMYVEEFLYPHKTRLDAWVRSKVAEYGVDLSARPGDTLARLIGYLKWFIEFYEAQLGLIQA